LIDIELNQIGVCATIIQELRESCEIDWYLQGELAYNKRLSAKYSVDKNINSALANKAVQKERAKKIHFIIPRLFQ